MRSLQPLERWRLEPGPDDSPVWTFKRGEVSRRDRIVDLYRGGANVTEIAREIGVGKPSVSKALARAAKLGLVVIRTDRIPPP